MNIEMSRLASVLRDDGFGQSHKRANVHVIEVRKGKRPGVSARTDWLLVEKREAVEYDTCNEVHRASLRISYWCLTDSSAERDVPDGEFSACYDRIQNMVSITSDSLSTGGYVLIEPQRLRGAGLGTYFMNTAVLWVKQWPDASLREIELPRGEAQESEGQRRRVHFYQKFGVQFSFAEQFPHAGISTPMLARELIAASNWHETITEHNVIIFLRSLVRNEQSNAAEIEFLKKSVKKDGAILMDAYRHPVRWMLQRLVMDDLVRSGAVFAISILVVLVLYRAFYMLVSA